MPSYSTEAITLRTTRFGESDKIVTFFTPDHGKISAIAKSALKPTSKFGGRLEVFSHNNIHLAKGRNLDILSQAETINTFYSLRENEGKLSAGYYMARILYYFLEERAGNEELFILTINCLKSLEAGDDPRHVERAFDIRFADLEGFLPLKSFPSDIIGVVEGIKDGRSGDVSLSRDQIMGIDMIMMPCLCEHVGKDIRSWKSM